MLWLTANIVRDHGIGSIKNVLSAAVVLRKNNRGGAPTECSAEVVEITCISTTKCINRLVLIPDYAHVAVNTSEHEDDLVLCNVGVLVFIDEDVLKAITV